MSLKQLSGQTLIYGLSNVLPRLLNFVLITPLITRVLAPEEQGQVGDLMFWVALFIAALTLRMDTAVFRFATRSEHDPRAVFRRVQALVTGVTLVVVGGLLLAAPVLADWLEYPDSADYVRLALVTVAFDVLSAVPLARLRLENRAWTFVFVNFGNVLLSIALTFGLLYFLPRYGQLGGIEYLKTFRVGYFLIALAAASGLRYLLLLLDGLLRYRAGPTERGAPAVATLLRYSLPLTVVAVAGIVSALAGPSVLKWWFGETVTENLYWSGQFSAALRLAVFLNLFITAYNYAAEPFFFRQAGSDLATAKREIYADALRAYGLVGTLAAAGILILLPWLQLFIGADVRVGLYVLPYLLMANFMLGLYYNFSIAYKLTDRTYLGAIISTLGATIAVVGTILFAGRYGIYAPALSMLAGFTTMASLAYLVTRRYFPVPYPLGRLFVYGALAAGAVLLAERTDGPWLRVVILATLVAIVLLLEQRWLRRTFGRSPAGNL